jgi:ABC-type bacteriocin/lantibiotic exporter with double-glycine peptidase domain
VYVVFKFTAHKGLESSLEESKYKYKVAHWLQEIARTVTSFKLSGRTSLALQKNDELVVKYLEKREKHFNILVIQFVQMISFKVIVTISLLILGGLLVLNQQMNIGQFVAAEIIILLVIASVEKLILSLEVFYDVLTSLEKLGEVVDKELESQDGDSPIISEEFNLELKNVDYGVPNRDQLILNGINLQLNKQSKILIKGESGSGKSTLLRILAGIIKPTRGSVYINDFSIDNLKLNHYRSHIGLVLLEETLFEGTLRENIVFNNDSIADNELFEILQNLGLKEFVKSLPNGLSTMIFPDDKQVSYTVSKRLLLARAIIKQPKLLILEEPLEHLEEKDTKYIIDYLSHPKHQWAIVVVSRNAYWETKCNAIVLLNNGQIS